MGWCVGQIAARNQDARFIKVIEGVRLKVNFLVHYEIDQQTAKTVLRLDEYNGDEDAACGCCWRRRRDRAMRSGVRPVHTYAVRSSVRPSVRLRPSVHVVVGSPRRAVCSPKKPPMSPRMG